MINFTSKGDFKKTLNSLARLQKIDTLFSGLDRYGEIGVNALAQATPIDTGRTASSWEYKITKTGKRRGIEWYNTNINNGASIAILIQYGHGTGSGGYIQGRDYINPAIQPIFDNIADEITRRLTA